MSIRERCQAFLVLGALLLAGSAWGQEPVVDFNIPPQGLAQALDALSRQGQVEIISDGTALKNKQSQGLTGPYTIREAVEKLLAGSGLTHTFTAENAVAIKKQEGVAVNDSADTKKAQKGNDEPTVLEEMTVTAKPTDETSYNVFDATTATKTDTPIMETPVSIQVVPQQVLKDRKRLLDPTLLISGLMD
ncbi:MAG: hypothetical protein ACREYE_17355 [Gammaproteobacteria bacterium]